MKIVTVLLVVVTNVFFAGSSLFFKIAVDKIGKIETVSFPALPSLVPRFLSSPAFLAGIAAGVAGSVCYFFMLARMNLSIAYPLLSLAYIIVACASVVFLKETIALPTWIGILLICLGVALVSVKGQ